MISNFSLRQRLHLLLELLYGECDARMRQEVKCSMLLSLNKWSEPATVVTDARTPRSYIVKTPRETLRRNSKHL